MKIIESNILNKFENLTFGFSTKIGLDRAAPYHFNLSYATGDDDIIVSENRLAFFNSLGLDENSIAFQNQVHSDIVEIVDSPGSKGECDAMITSVKGLGLAIVSADCTANFIYDRCNQVIAGVHSGWRGTEKKILSKTLNTLSDKFNSQPDDLFVFISPAISQMNYEVGKEVAALFDSKYVIENNNSLYLDVTSANLEMLLNFGIPEDNIEVSKLCSFANLELLHSYRRDGIQSGRAMGIIALKEE